MKTNVKVFLLLMGAILMNSCGSFQVINGDGNIVTKEVNISEYDGIEVSGGNITVEYAQKEDVPRLTVTTDQNIFDMYDFAVSGNILRVKPKKEYSNSSFRPTKFILETNSGNLRKIAGGGSSIFNFNTPFTTDKLEVKISGSGTINMNHDTKFDMLSVGISGSGTVNGADIDGGNIDGSISGSGRFNLGGTADKASFSISGSGRVRGYELTVNDLETRISGSGSVEMTVNNSIDARVSGSGTIRYKGTPTNISQSISGSGSVKQVTD